MFAWMVRDKGSEWRALQRLQAQGQLLFRPVVEAVCEPFMQNRDRPGKTPHVVMGALSERLSSLTDTGRVWLDLGNLSRLFSGNDLSEMLRLVGRYQGLLHHLIVPIVRTSSDDSFVEEVVRWVQSSGSGICIRVDGLTHLKDKARRAADIAKAVKLGIEKVDLLVDAQDLPRSFSHEEVAQAIPLSQESRSWIWAAGTFPASITPFEPDVYEHRFERTEWTTYAEEFSRPLRMRRPTYADFATQPSVYEPSPPYRASPSLRYTLGDDFLVLRGRGGKNSSSAQYIGHARYLMTRDYFEDITATEGDQYVAFIGSGQNKTGNSTTWRVASLLRHLGVVAAQVAAQPAMSGDFGTW